MTQPEVELVASGFAALRSGDAATARQIFVEQLGDSSSAAVIEGRARTLYLEMQFASAIEQWERAYAAYRANDEPIGSIRVARALSYMYWTIVGDRAVSGGWLSRAQRLLGAEPEASEAGWVALNQGMFTQDRAQKEVLFRQALDIAHALRETELELVTLAYLGASIVHAERTEEGMMLLDEALAGVAGDELDDFVLLEDIFCQLFSACEHAHDVGRADQWIRVGESIAQRRKLPVVAAFCRTHYGGVLTTAGRWTEAGETLTEAARLWNLGQRSQLRMGALVRLADLRARQGRFEEAEQLLENIDADAEFEAARPRAAIHLARGQFSVAADVLERALAQLDVTSTSTASLLALLVDVHLAAGNVDGARTAAERLGVCATLHQSNYLLGSAALARGRVCLASGTGDPQACLREALAGFSRAQMPVEVAHSRLQLANALVHDQPDVAMSEARAALEAFGKLRAARDADQAAALLRSLGVRTASPARRSDGELTKREVEVLDLLGHGLSNPEISDRLFISRKTVEHHVGNILAKLGLRSRGEAAAYATRARSAVK